MSSLRGAGKYGEAKRSGAACSYPENARVSTETGALTLARFAQRTAREKDG
ncbi:hypothetical protein LNP74_27225 [Klebsiella pneumoniae subsp. pneumoniae]|nr:hypothetical protein [Klebsiella pneumoniae subsp. pneumoniae]